MVTVTVAASPDRDDPFTTIVLTAAADTLGPCKSAY
jgi:hypothetical protein